MADPKRKLLIGTRGSKLAMAQANLVASFLRTAGMKVKIEPMVTAGDRVRGNLSSSGGKGLFVKELEEALQYEKVDLAVHSMKDVPALIGKGLAIVAVTRREDARDVMISGVARTLKSLPSGARVGTSSPRRRAQLMRDRDDLEVVPIRGNIDTRLKKLKAGEAEAIIVAAAGLVRLKVPKVITQYLPADRFIPSVGQGTIAVEARYDDVELSRLVQRVCHHLPTAMAVRAERAFLKRVGGDCFTPMAAYATLRGKELKLRGFLATPDGSRSETEIISGAASNAVDLGKQLADILLAKLAGKSVGKRV